MIYRYYYHTNLSDIEQQCYKALLGCMERREREVTAPVLPSDSRARVRWSLKYDNPQLYYVDFSNLLRATSDHSDFYTINYRMDRKTHKETEDKIRRAIAPLIRRAAGKPKDKQYRLIHNWLLYRAVYSKCEDRSDHNITGPILNGKSVCEGYAMAFKYIADRLRIESMVVIGDMIKDGKIDGSHAWNLIKSGGRWYHVDVTFDGGYGKDVYSKAYYMISSNEMWKKRLPDDTLKIPACVSSARPLKRVAGTRELLDYLKEEHGKGKRYSEVMLSRGFDKDRFVSMIAKGIKPSDRAWYRDLNLIWYSDNARTCLFTWKQVSR